MVDWILAGILIVAAVYGYISGFLKSLIGVLGNIVALILSYLFASPLAQLLDEQFGLLDRLSGYIRNALPMPEEFSQVVASIDGMAKVYEELDRIPLPQAMKESIMQTVQEQVNNVGQGVFSTMADIVANTVAQSVMQGLTFVGLWIILCILLTLTGNLLVGVVRHIPVVSTLDRLAGMAVCLLLAAITILILCQGIQLLGILEGNPLEQSVVLHFLRSVLWKS